MVKIIKKIRSYLIDIGINKHINDEVIIKKVFKKNMGYDLDLDNPKTYNEKLQWLKLHDRNPQYTVMVDKYEAKEYVSSIIGDKYIIPTLGIYNKFKEIDFDQLPNQFVMKCTHDSGGIYICRDKNKINILKLRIKFNLLLKRNFYYRYREWPYKNVKPRIIIEKYLDSKTDSLKDYKFFCFNGKPEIMYVSEGLENHNTASMSFYDMNFKLVDCKRSDYKLLDYMPKKPINFDLMKKKSEELSRNIPHIRVDFYEIDGHLYFGELTFFTCSGMIPFEDKKWDVKMGKMINLSVVKKK